MEQLDLFGNPVSALPAKKPAVKKIVFPEIKKEEVIEAVIPVPQKPIALKKEIVANGVKSTRGRKALKDLEIEADLIDLPDDETLSKKLYYSISEVAGWFKVNNSLLRFWANEFTILQPRKNRKGDRLFRVEDIKNIRLIYFLLREKKYSMEGAKQFLADKQQQARAQFEITASLNKMRNFLLELKANLGE